MLTALVRGGGSKPSQDAVKAAAAEALWALTDGHAENKAAASGSISVLVALLAGGSSRAQQHAANALASLGRGNQNNQASIASKLVEILLSEDGSSAPEATPAAATAVATAAKGSDDGSRVSRVSGEWSQHHDDDAARKAAAKRRRSRNPKSTRTQQFAISVLWRLLEENAANQRTIANASHPSHLIRLLKGSFSEGSNYALWALSLSIDEGNQSTVLQEGGVAPIVCALEGAGHDVATDGDSPAEALRGDARSSTEKALRPGEDIEAQPRSNEAVPPLPSSSDEASVQLHAAAALALLARGSTPAQKAIAEAGGIAPLVRIVASRRLETESETEHRRAEEFRVREEAASEAAERAIREQATKLEMSIAEVSAAESGRPTTRSSVALLHVSSTCSVSPII